MVVFTSYSCSLIHVNISSPPCLPHVFLSLSLSPHVLPRCNPVVALLRHPFVAGVAAQVSDAAAARNGSISRAQRAALAMATASSSAVSSASFALPPGAGDANMEPAMTAQVQKE